MAVARSCARKRSIHLVRYEGSKIIADQYTGTSSINVIYCCSLAMAKSRLFRRRVSPTSVSSKVDCCSAGGMGLSKETSGGRMAPRLYNCKLIGCVNDEGIATYLCPGKLTSTWPSYRLGRTVWRWGLSPAIAKLCKATVIAMYRCKQILVSHRH
jgi:hypothetical protein